MGIELEIGLALAGAVIGVFFGLVAVPLFGRSVERFAVRLLSRFTRRLIQRDRDLSGIWRSTYIYATSDASGEWKGFHYVNIRQFQHRVTVYSLEHPEGSRLWMELEVDDLTVTGTWREETSKGFAFHGAIQFLLEPAGRGMSGQWVGFGRSGRINTNRWTLERMTDSRRRRDRQRFTQRGRREFALERHDLRGSRIVGYPDGEADQGE